MTRQRKGRGGTESNYHREVRWPIGRCRRCGKDIYLSRANARRGAKDLPPAPSDRGGRGRARPRAYPCPHTAGHWHIGHLPDSVRKGTYSKRAYKQGQERHRYED